jgi:hypothetical protein
MDIKAWDGCGLDYAAPDRDRWQDFANIIINLYVS